MSAARNTQTATSCAHRLRVRKMAGMKLHVIEADADAVDILNRPHAAKTRGQLAAFPLDVPTDPAALLSVDVPRGVQSALFDPEVTL